MAKITIAFVFILFLAEFDIASAQQPPYDVAPDVKPPYYRVRYEASPKDGELDIAVKYTVWIPPGAKLLRGIVVHQHGCGEGSCKSGLTGAFDLHWQALAAKHNCALLAPSYEQPEDSDCQLWCDPRNGSDAAFRGALIDLGKASGHPELERAPWALWGHSGGATWCGCMTLLYPKRVAATWMRSGIPPVTPRLDKPSRKIIPVPNEPLDVPMMVNLGTKEGVTVTEGRFAGVWPRAKDFFRLLRRNGSPIGVSVDPLTGHECGNQRYLAIPWFDACLTARLSAKPDEPLRSMPKDRAWLVDFSGSHPVPKAEYAGDPRDAIWLPNQRIAKAWLEYVTDTQVTDASPPPAPTNVTMSDGLLTWDATADLDSGIQHFAIERDGKLIANVSGGKNPFGRPIFQGLQYSDTPLQPLVQMRFTDPDWRSGGNSRYRVITVNTAGLRSK